MQSCFVSERRCFILLFEKTTVLAILHGWVSVQLPCLLTDLNNLAPTMAIDRHFFEQENMAEAFKFSRCWKIDAEFSRKKSIPPPKHRSHLSKEKQKTLDRRVSERGAKEARFNYAVDRHVRRSRPRPSHGGRS